MMTNNRTEGAALTVKTAYVALGAGVGGVVLAASTTGAKRRVVGAEISLSAAGSVTLYHGAAVASGKMICAAQLAAGIPLVPSLGDWASQVSAANEKISADVIGGTAWICIKYIDLE